MGRKGKHTRWDWQEKNAVYHLFIDGLSNKDISHQTGVPVRTIRHWRTNARNNIEIMSGFARFRMETTAHDELMSRLFARDWKATTFVLERSETFGGRYSDCPDCRISTRPVCRNCLYKVNDMLASIDYSCPECGAPQPRQIPLYIKPARGDKNGKEKRTPSTHRTTTTIH